MVHSFPTTVNPTTVALVLAGGRGIRLAPLTDYRSKPAVPFAGNYRLIDVAMSNLSHSRIDDVWVVEQYRPFTLNAHLAAGRPWDLDGTRHGLRVLSPAEGREEDGFSEGTGLELDKRGWEILAHLNSHAPTRISASAKVSDSLIAQGAVIHGSVEHSVIGPEVVIEDGAHVSRSVLLGRTVVPAGASLESVIADIGAPIEAKRLVKLSPDPAISRCWQLPAVGQIPSNRRPNA